MLRLALSFAAVCTAAARLGEIAVGTGDEDAGTCSGTAYDFFELVTQWDITECMSVFSCTSTNQFTTMHGLWPSRLTSSNYPCNCNAQPFNQNNISSILDQMNKYWPSLNGPSATFWSHEWSKHGTCALDIFRSQLDYFNGGLTLRSTFDVIPALATAGITPSNTQGFTLAEFKAAIAAAYGPNADVAVSCDANGNIEEITQCFTPSLRPVLCPSYEPTCAKSTLYLPSQMQAV